MADADLATADAVAAVFAWLKDHPQIPDLLGGPEHVSGLMEAPWPHLAVDDGPGGDLRGLVWSMELEVTLELYGSPDGYPGKAALWRLAIRLAQLVKDMPEEQDPTPGQPTVCRVRPSGVVAWSPTAVGQPRYLVGLLVVIHPPLA